MTAGKIHWVWVGVLSPSICLSLPTLALADIEEISVTARKRLEPAQSVPTALNVMDGELLNSRSIKNTDDVEKLFPGLSTNNSTATNAGFAIRGVGTNNIHVSAQQSVGTVIDDVSAVSPFVSAIAIFDMERIEVLRGPQNTLYGRNTTGGVVNFISRKADLSDGLNGNANLKAGEGGLLEFEAALGFNISESVALRAALMNREFDGRFTNIVDGKDVGRKDSKGARINLFWQVTPSTSTSFTFSKGAADGDNLISRSIGMFEADGATTCDAFVNGGESAFTAGRNDCWTPITLNMINGNDYLASQLAAGNSDLLIANPNPASNTLSPYLINYSAEWGETYHHPANFYDAEFTNYRARLVHDFASSQLTLLSAYDETYVLNMPVYDLTGFTGGQEVDFEVWQHEARLTSTGASRLQWLMGVHYSTQTSTEDTWVLRTDPFVAGGNGISPSILIDSKYRNFSVYGQADYALTDSFTVTAGLRYTDDKLQGVTQKFVCTPGQHLGPTFDGIETLNRDYRFANCLDISATLVDDNPTQELSKVGWKLGVSWQAKEHVMLYASTAYGFKGGAYDNRALDIGSSPTDPEFLTAYEIGLKSDFIARNLRLNAAAYHYNWHDLQLFGLDDNGGPLQVNVPHTKISGLEVELQWDPTKALHLHAGVAFNKSNVRDVSELPASLDIQEGNSITNSPETSLNLLANYTIEIGQGELSLQADFQYQSSAFFIIGSQDTTRSKSDAHNWLNARVSYSFGENLQYLMALWANNLTAEKSCQYLPASLPGGTNWGCNINNSGQRSFGVSLGVKF